MKIAIKNKTILGKEGERTSPGFWLSTDKLKSREKNIVAIFGGLKKETLEIKISFFKRLRSKLRSKVSETKKSFFDFLQSIKWSSGKEKFRPLLQSIKLNNWKGKIALVLLMISLINGGFFAFRPEVGAFTYTFTQTDWSGGVESGAYPVHPGDRTGYTEYNANSNLNHSGTQGQATINQGSGTLAESFDTTTYKDAANTTANWVTTGGGQLEMNDSVATNLNSKVVEAWGMGQTVYGYVSGGGKIYFGMDKGKFGAYDPATDTITDLTSKISAIISSSYYISALGFDTTNNVVYLGSNAGYSVEYNTVSEIATNVSAKFFGMAISTFAYVSSDNTMYAGTSSGYFLKYDIGTNTGSDLTSKISSFWTGSTPIRKMYYYPASGVIYLGGDGGNMAKYNIAGDTATNLRGKLTSTWGTNGSVATTFFADGKIYIGGETGEFAVYDIALDSVTDLTYKIAAFINQPIRSFAYDTTNSILYVGGTGGQFFKYDPASGTVTNLGGRLSPLNWYGIIYSMTYVASNQTLYFAGGGGAFAKLDIFNDTVTNLTGKISGFWNTSEVTNIVYRSANSSVYLAGWGGKFAVYDTVGESAVNLTDKISGFWSTNNIRSMAHDATNGMIYLGGDQGNFAQYDIGGNSALDLKSKISGVFGAYAVWSMTFDTANSKFYLGSYNYGKFVQYNPAGGGTATNLTDRVSSFMGSGYSNGFYSLTFDSSNAVIYFGGYGAKFGKYTIGTDAGADLSSKIHDASVWKISSPVYSITQDTANNMLYLGGTSKFAKLNPADDSVTDLSSKISAFSGYGVYSMVYDDTGGTVYLGFNSGGLAKYTISGETLTNLTTKISSFWSTNVINALAYDSVNRRVYVGGAYQVGRYNILADTGENLLNQFNAGMALLPSQTITASVFDSVHNVIYLGANSANKFLKYDLVSGVATDLTAKLTALFSNVSIYSMVYDPVGNAIYLGMSGGKFGKYDLGTETASNLTTKISGFWSSNAINSLVYTGGKIFLGGVGGKFAKYTISGETVSDYTGNISGFWSTNQINAITVDGAGANVYLVGAGGKFASLNIAGEAATDLTANISGFWSTTVINAVTFDTSNSVVYFAGQSGKFGKYTVGTGIGANLTSTISAIFSNSTLMSLTYDPTGVVYIGADVAKLGRYNIGSNDSTSFTSKISSFFLASYIYELFLGTNATFYLAGYQGFGSIQSISTQQAQSLNVNSGSYLVSSATLTKSDTPGTGTITYYLSNDGGANFSEVTPGSAYTFGTIGSDLRWKIRLTGNATVQSIGITYGGYYASGNITSTFYNSTAVASVTSRLEWTENENLPAATAVKFQVKTAPNNDNGTPADISDDFPNTGGGTDFLGPDGTTGTYFTNSAAGCSKVIGTVTCNISDGITLGDGTNDQWFQYKMILDSTTGVDTATVFEVKVVYVANAAPEVQNVTAEQNSDGTVTINYEVRDPDASGGVTQNAVAVTLQYCTANCTNPGSETWTNAVSVSGSGEVGAGVSVEEVNWTEHSFTWTAKTDYDGQYLDDIKVRIKADDSEAANRYGYGTSAAFSLDTKNPGNVELVINNATDKLTIALPTEDSTYQMSISNTEGVFDTFIDYQTPYDYDQLNGDPFTVYLRVRDAFGNYTDVSAVTPAKPGNMVFYDTSNPLNDEYREFIAWSAISPLQVGSGFANYNIWRSTDGTNYARVYQEPDRTRNYYGDLDLDAEETYYYKVTAEDSDGNISNFSDVVSDQPNGTGSSDTTPPTITGVAVTNVNTTSATITWTTDEISETAVGYSEDQTYLPERGNASLVTEHSLTITGLDPETTYHIRVKSRDLHRNLSQVDESSPGGNNPDNFSFTTHPGPAIYNVSVQQAANEQATIFWLTNTDSNSYVAYAEEISEGSLVDPVGVWSPDLVGGSSPYEHTQVITGLEEGKTYYFYVKSVDGSENEAINDNGGEFFQLTTTADNQAPGLSEIEAAVVNHNQAAMSWITDESSNSKVEYGTEAGHYDFTGTVDLLDRSHFVVLTGLDPDTEYFYRVSSTDINGNEAVSEEDSFVTLMEPEFQHDPLSEISDISDPPIVVTDTKAVISFNTDQSAQCVIEYGTEAGNYTEVPVGETDFNDNHAIHLPGLIFSTTYYYQITCEDNIENVVSSEENSFTTLEKQYSSGEIGELIDSIAPEISSVGSTATTGESVTVEWKTNELAASYVRFGIDDTYGNMAGNDLVNSLKENYVTSHSVIVNGLTPATKYLFTVISIDEAGNIAESNQSSFTTKAPSSLSSIKVASTEIGKATITWSSDQALSSVVEYGLTTAYGEIKESTTKTKAHEVAISGLSAGSVYHFRVKGEDADKNLYSSGDYTLEPKSPPTISNLTVKDVSENKAMVEFSTNVPTDATVLYTDNKDSKNSGSQGKPDLATTHKVELSNLASGATFALKVRVRDELGNDAELDGKDFTTAKDETAPEISQTRTESAMAQNEKVQTIISWVTNEPATTVFIYREGVNGEEKEVEISNALTLAHVAVVTTFKPGTVYYFRIKSVDQAGNVALSKEHAMLTPKKRENIVQIIVTNFQDIFSWVTKI